MIRPYHHRRIPGALPTRENPPGPFVFSAGFWYSVGFGFLRSC